VPSSRVKKSKKSRTLPRKDVDEKVVEEKQVITIGSLEEDSS
jgi:hypothetical protein